MGDDSTTDVTCNVHPADVSTEAAHILAGVEAADALKIEDNWRRGNYDLKKIQCRSNNSKGVKCLQYDDDKIVSGLCDNTIKFWELKSLEYTKVLTGHTGSVLCLQYDEDVIITGSSDSTVRLWDVKTGKAINTLMHHCEPVLHLRFDNGLMVTCSKIMGYRV